MSSSCGPCRQIGEVATLEHVKVNLKKEQMMEDQQFAAMLYRCALLVVSNEMGKEDTVITFEIYSYHVEYT